MLAAASSGGPDQHQLPVRRRRAAVPVRRQPTLRRRARRARARRARDGRAARVRAVRWTLAAAPDYEAALAAASDRRDSDGRSGDDLYVIYTGGTTGMPKGVVWRQEDAFFACIGGGDPMRLRRRRGHPAEMPRPHGRQRPRLLAVAPLMHAAAQWTAFMSLFAAAGSCSSRARSTRRVWRHGAASG